MAHGIIFWDMAGTLLARDRRSGKLLTMPGCRKALTELGRDFTLCVTTGDSAAGARLLLQQAGLLGHFAEVLGGLWAPAGKPYGEILAERDVQPDKCLAIGDRLDADLPSDTDRLVTVLVNQDGFDLHADTIVALVRLLGDQGGGFLPGFDRLFEEAEPVAGAEPARRLWSADLQFELMRLRHPALSRVRPVVILPG